MRCQSKWHSIKLQIWKEICHETKNQALGLKMQKASQITAPNKRKKERKKTLYTKTPMNFFYPLLVLQNKLFKHE